MANFETDTKADEEILLFNSIYRNNGEGFNGFIKLVEIYPHVGKGGDAVIESRTKALCEEYEITSTIAKVKMLKRGAEYYNKHCAMCFKVSDDTSSVSHTGVNINS